MELVLIIAAPFVCVSATLILVARYFLHRVGARKVAMTMGCGQALGVLLFILIPIPFQLGRGLTANALLAELGIGAFLALMVFMIGYNAANYIYSAYSESEFNRIFRKR